MATVTGSASSSSKGTFTPSNTLLQSFSIDTASLKCNWGNASSGADKVDLVYRKKLSLAAAAQTIDLTSLTDPEGVAVNFARVRRLRVRHKGQTDGQPLTLSGGASDPWAAIWGAAGALTIQPSSASNDAWHEFTAPNTTGHVVSGTSKTIKLDPGANTFDAEIEIDGCSA